ncbi:hypothetical protein ACKAV7_008734 [Fusarium commune]
MTRSNWPRTRNLVHGPVKSQRYSCKDIEVDVFNRYEILHSDDTGSLSGDKSSGDHESSEDDEGFEASEREDSLDDWISDTESRDVPDVSPFCEDSDHKFCDESAVKSVEGFLELLFELNL